MSEIRCPACGTRNRIPTGARGRPRCARCKTDLPWIVEAGDADFDTAVAGSTPAVVDLWAPWCGPCRMIAPALEELARERAGRLKVVKVNVDESPGVSRRFAVQSIPLLLLVRDGEVIDRQVGAAPKAAIEAWIDRALEAA
ncbi:MAG: thioredoxin [Actinomyces sp.]|nr:MAG: thioredoxin [Actinomyces sp.]